MVNLDQPQAIVLADAAEGPDEIARLDRPAVLVLNTSPVSAQAQPGYTVEQYLDLPTWSEVGSGKVPISGKAYNMDSVGPEPPDKPARPPSMLIGGGGNYGVSSTNPEPPDKRAYSISKQRGKYSPLTKKSREVEAAWTATTEVLNRVNGRDPVMGEQLTGISAEIREFQETTDRCVTSGSPCPIHGTRSSNKCISDVTIKADELIGRLAQLRHLAGKKPA